MASIRQKQNGKWEVRYYKDGRQRGKSFASKREAERFDAHNQVKIDKGEWIDPNMQRILFSDFIDHEWWAAKEAQGIRPNTTSLYEYLLRCHILPTFGNRRLVEINAKEIDQWTAKLARTDLSQSTRAKAFRLLAGVMKLAVERDRLVKSPVPKHGPKETQQEMQSLTRSEVKAVAEAIDQHYGALVTLCGFTGLRWGEAVGLRPERVDLLHRKIRVEEQLTEVNGHHAFSEPKTANSKRTISIPAFLVPILDEQINERSRNGLVFPGKDGEPIRRSNFTRRVWKPALKKAGVPEVRFHDLRHSAVRFAIAQGRTAEQLTRWIGHSSIATTIDRYGGWFPETQDQIADGMDDLWNEEPEDKATVLAIGS